MNGFKLLKSGAKVFGNFCGDDVRIREIVGIFEAFIFEPEDVEAQFIPLEQFFIRKGAPPALRIFWRPCWFSVKPIFGAVALNKFVEVGSL